MEAVIDTNVWLDWLVFADPVSVPLAQARAARRLRILVAPRMRAELARVLAYPKLSLQADPQARAMAAFDELSEMQAEPPGAPISCRDPDDQVFIDLALTRPGCWLLSRDHHVLALRRAAAKHCVRIARPGDTAWLNAIASEPR